MVVPPSTRSRVERPAVWVEACGGRPVELARACIVNRRPILYHPPKSRPRPFAVTVVVAFDRQFPPTVRDSFVRNSYFSSVSRLIFSPISAEMLNSNFLSGEEVQNFRFLKFRFLFWKGVHCDLFFLSGCQGCFFSTWHPSLIIHKIFIRNNALQDYRHHSSS